jgi:hypothetical protein
MIIHRTSPNSTGGHTQPSTWFTVSDPMGENQAGQREEHRRRCCPALGLVSEPYRQHCQQCPTESKCQQDHAGEDILLRLDERGSDENQRSNEANGQRSGDNPPNAAPRTGLRRPSRVTHMSSLLAAPRFDRGHLTSSGL